MRIFILILILVVLAIAAAFAYVRLAPSDPARWHTDPAQASPASGHYVVKPEGGDTDGPLLDMTPTDALVALDAIARATPRTQVLAGSPDEGRITYITRSRLWGFPDYTTVEAISSDEGTRLLIHARLRFGADDLGVNAARVQSWLAALGS